MITIPVSRSCRLAQSFKRLRRSYATSPNVNLFTGSGGRPPWISEHGGPKKGDKITVAMSGGVDSSVTLALLATSPESYDLDAVFMRNWSPMMSEVEHQDWDGETACEWEKDWEDVRRVCAGFGVQAKMIDLSNEYWLNVFEPSVEIWEKGQTPNPDVSCNREIKFGALMDKALTSTSYLATGHYARLGYTSEGRTKLLRSSDEKKDQTYYLSSVPEEKLSRAICPLATFPKPQVRQLAKSFNLPTANREESMGVCFIGERGKFGDFVSQYTSARSAPGHTITHTGRILATHKGLWHYTIGQKARLGGMDEKWFVSGKNEKRNEVVVVPGSDHPALFCSSLVTDDDFHWIWKDHPPSNEIDSVDGMKAKCQVRHRMKAVDVVVRRSGTQGAITVSFPKGKEEKGVAPGQIVGIWDESNEWCLGSGMIEKTICLA